MTESLSLRDQFAIQAMHALLTYAKGRNVYLSDHGHWLHDKSGQQLGLMSYQIADAMLAARLADVPPDQPPTT